MNTKIYYYLIGGLVLGIIGLLLFQNNIGNLKDTVVLTTETGAIIAPGAIVDIGNIISSGSVDTGNQSSPLVYVNKEYGFQLTLPKGWEKYKVFVYPASKELQEAYSGFMGSIKIAIPTSASGRYGIEDPNKPINSNPNTYIKGYAQLFNIGIWTPEGYKKEYTRCTPYPDPSCDIEMLGSNTKYNFTYSGPGDMPTDLYPIRGSSDYFLKILSTFKSL